MSVMSFLPRIRQEALLFTYLTQWQCDALSIEQQ